MRGSRVDALRPLHPMLTRRVPCVLQTDLADGALELNDTLLAAVGADYAASGDLQVRTYAAQPFLETRPLSGAELHFLSASDSFSKS